MVAWLEASDGQNFCWITGGLQSNMSGVVVYPRDEQTMICPFEQFVGMMVQDIDKVILSVLNSLELEKHKILISWTQLAPSVE